METFTLSSISSAYMKDSYATADRSLASNLSSNATSSCGGIRVTTTIKREVTPDQIPEVNEQLNASTQGHGMHAAQDYRANFDNTGQNDSESAILESCNGPKRTVTARCSSPGLLGSDCC